jgi:hypothetical protein
MIYPCLPDSAPLKAFSTFAGFLRDAGLFDIAHKDYSVGESEMCG